MKAALLALDDDPLVLQTFEEVLQEKYSLKTTQEISEAEKWMAEKKPEAVLLDLHLENGESLGLLKNWNRLYPTVPVVICSGETRIKKAVEYLREGAVDYLVKPFLPQELENILKRVLQKKSYPNTSFFAFSSITQELLKKAECLRGKRNLNILITGESGTGKEILARFLHGQETSPRPFVTVNSPAIPSNLFEAELFGVEKGAFTDAKFSRPGKFELADGGDLFLDEIGELSLEVQPKILRVLQDKNFEKLGSSKNQYSDIRILSATNKNLSQMVQESKFRQDLFYRLSDVVLHIPPLRERKKEIPHFVNHFVSKHSLEKVSVSQEAIDSLQDHEWPGNIRELECVVKRALVFCENQKIEKFEWKTHPTETPEKACLEKRMQNHRKDIVRQTLLKNQGDRVKTCEELGISEASFYRYIQS